MEEIVNSILNKDLDKIEIYIKLVDHNEKVKLFYLLLNEIVDEKINDNYSSAILYQFCKNGLKVNEIDDIIIIITMIRKKKFLDSYRVLMVTFKQLIYKKKIMNVTNVFRSSTKNIRKKIEGIDSPEEVIRLINKYLLLLANSFDDAKYIATLKHSGMIERITHGKITQDMWERSQTIELKNRLKSLIKIFGLFALSNCNIKIITEDYFDNMRFKKRIKYYELCVNKLIKYLCTIKCAYGKYKMMKNAMDNIGGYYFDYVDDLSEDESYDCCGGYVHDEDDMDDSDSINISLVKIGNPDEIYHKKLEVE